MTWLGQSKFHTHPNWDRSSYSEVNSFSRIWLMQCEIEPLCTSMIKAFSFSFSSPSGRTVEMPRGMSLAHDGSKNLKISSNCSWLISFSTDRLHITMFTLRGRLTPKSLMRTAQARKVSVLASWSCRASVNSTINPLYQRLRFPQAVPHLWCATPIAFVPDHL